MSGSKKPHSGARRKRVTWFRCPHCKHKSYRKSNMKRHIRDLHTAIKNLECCGRVFNTKGDAREHKREMHPNGFECTICGSISSRSQLLTRHMGKHTGAKPFTCSACGYGTPNKHNLIRHLKSCMKKPVNPEAASKQLAAMQAAAKRRRKIAQAPQPGQDAQVEQAPQPGPAPQAAQGEQAERNGFSIRELLCPDRSSSIPEPSAPKGKVASLTRSRVLLSGVVYSRQTKRAVAVVTSAVLVLSHT